MTETTEMSPENRNRAYENVKVILQSMEHIDASISLKTFLISIHAEEAGKMDLAYAAGEISAFSAMVEYEMKKKDQTSSSSSSSSPSSSSSSISS